MSGMFGILTVDGAPVSREDLGALADQFHRRGPDRAAIWCQGTVGLGQTLLTTTDESREEQQPLTHAASGCVIVADVRLDNRDDLCDALRLSGGGNGVGDAALILEAYLAWGEDCPARLMGDFAFAIWNPRRHALFCARDQFGLRPFYYHHTPGRFFVFGSEARALLVLPKVPLKLNEGRIADAMIPPLQWIDHTSTFYCDISRLPPAHTAMVTVGGLRVRRYWQLEPGPELRLSSDNEYADALREVLTRATRARLRGAGRVGSTLSGGLDSSAVTALARDLCTARGALPLPTFSAVSPDGVECAETQASRDVVAMGGVEPHRIDYDALDVLQPHLADLTWHSEEPFDFSMVLMRSIYLTAARQGVRVVLDGLASDVVLGSGTYLSRLFRKGHAMSAIREARALERFSGRTPHYSQALRSLRSALTPAPIQRVITAAANRHRRAAMLKDLLVNSDFARRVSLDERFETMDRTYGDPNQQGYLEERASSILPNLTAGHERYNRIASAVGVERADPFIDRRVVAFCVSLPGPQRLHDGWTKVILRRAMAGRLPESVRWRRGWDHLGSRFQRHVVRSTIEAQWADPTHVREMLAPFVDLRPLEVAARAYFTGQDPSWEATVFRLTHLAHWLDRAGVRPSRVD